MDCQAALGDNAKSQGAISTLQQVPIWCSKAECRETHLLIHGVHSVFCGAIDVNEWLPWELQICCQPPVCLRKQGVLQSGMRISSEGCHGHAHIMEEGCIFNAMQVAAASLGQIHAVLSLQHGCIRLALCNYRLHNASAAGHLHCLRWLHLCTARLTSRFKVQLTLSLRAVSFLVAGALSSERVNRSILGSIRKGTRSCRFFLHFCKPAPAYSHRETATLFPDIWR